MLALQYNDVLESVSFPELTSVGDYFNFDVSGCWLLWQLDVRLSVSLSHVLLACVVVVSVAWPSFSFPIAFPVLLSLPSPAVARALAVPCACVA